MKIALVTDTHWGARGDSIHFADYFKKFYDEVFFPYLDEHNIKTVIHLGDIVERRKYINFVTAKRMYEDFISQCKKRDIDLHVIIGNHDTYYKNTNDYNAINVLFGHNDDLLTYYTSYTEREFYDKENDVSLSVAFIPWINSGNYEDTVEKIKKSRAEVAFGHLEIKGFEMYRGAPSDAGMSMGMFSNYDTVMSGHYHHKSSRGNIHYLGAPYEMSWSDYDDDRGFHVFDTVTRELTRVRNPYTMFNKVYYNDIDVDSIESLFKNRDFTFIRGTYVKVVVKDKNNPYWFDLFIDELTQNEPAHLQVVEDHLDLNVEDDGELVDEAEDTLTIIKRYVSNLNVKNHRSLERLLVDLYNEALTIE